MIQLLSLNLMNVYLYDEQEKIDSINWYKKLHPLQRLVIKDEVLELLLGVNYANLRKIFSLTQIIQITYHKLKLEDLLDKIPCNH